MLSRAYEWPLQATFAESSLARRVPLLRPSPCRPTPITTTVLLFLVRVDADGVMECGSPVSGRWRAREFEAVLGYLVDVGYLVRAEVEGDKAFRITVAGINEVQRRPQL